MTRRPFDPEETGDPSSDVDGALADLDRYVADTAEYPSSSFADDVMAALEHEPTPRRGMLGALGAWISAPGGGGRMALLAATVAVAVLAVVAFGRIGQLLPPSNIGGTPQPTIGAPSPEPSPSLEPSPSPTPTHSSRPTESQEPSDDGPDASDSPDPSDDNSGPGGGGGDNSGPGSSPSASDDSSGSGSGSDDSADG